MEFNKKNNAEKTGKISGFIIMYFLFTLVLYFILKLTDKFPKNWNFFHMIAITILITLSGALLKKILR